MRPWDVSVGFAQYEGGPFVPNVSIHLPARSLATGTFSHIARGEIIIDSREKLWFAAGMAMIVIGIFAFSGILELILAVGGVLVASQGRRRQA